MFERRTIKPTVPDPPVRKLKIEADGDPWKGLIKPKIRLMGRWLERAGFTPGKPVQVTCVAPGVLELRSPDVSTLNEASNGSSAQPDHLS
jgi:hypothetical protein